MLPHAALLDLIRSSESQFLERKAACPKGRELREALCAFANSTPEGQVSVLFIGIEEDGTIRGVASAELEPTQQTIMKVGRVECYPPVVVATQVATVEDKHVIAALVGFSKNRPHFTGHAFIRNGPRCDKASPQQFEELILKRTDKVRRILESMKDGQITVEWTVPSAADVHLHRPYQQYRKWSYRVTACDAYVLQLFAIEPSENMAFPLGAVTISYDTAHRRLMLIIDSAFLPEP